MAATTTCPDGHQSQATDWCDTCGIAMQPDPATATPSGPVAAGDCPNCGTAHHEDELFCEVCGLDFATGQLPEVAAAQEVPDESPAEAGATEPAGPRWTVTIAADRTWFDHNEAESGKVVEFPGDASARTVVLSGDVVTVGRRDDKRGWFPTIDLGVPVLDPSTSRKHAELRRVGDGWQVVDLESTNGTVVDGEKIAPGAPVDLVEGTVIHLGAFTRLTVHAPEEAQA